MIIDSGTWDDEIAKWAPGADITQVPYSMLTTRVKTAKGGSSPTTDLREELTRRWGTVILDEAHYCRGRRTHWTVAVQKLETDRMYQLTGTPLVNWAREAFVPLQLLWPEEAKMGMKYGSYWRWAKEWFEVGPKLDRGGRVLADQVVQDFRKDRTWEEFREENWGDRTLMRLREDVLDLPPLTVQQWMCPMVPEQRRVYKALKEDFVAWLDGGQEIVAWNQAAQLVKLAKCTTGLDVLDPSAKASGKLAALRTMLEDRPRPTLAVAHFRSTVAKCAEVAESLGKSVRVVDGGTSKPGRLAAVRAFQSGGLDVLCASIDVISEGLTLTAADQVVRVERSYLPSKNEQVIRRLHRIGQERPVTVVDLVTPDSTDQRQLQLLAAKTDEQMRALGADDLRSLVN